MSRHMVNKFSKYTGMFTGSICLLQMISHATIAKGMPEGFITFADVTTFFGVVGLGMSFAGLLFATTHEGRRDEA